MHARTAIEIVRRAGADWIEHDVSAGATVTALLFTLGKHLLGLHLGTSAIASTYGAAGSLVVLLLWIF